MQTPTLPFTFFGRDWRFVSDYLDANPSRFVAVALGEDMDWHVNNCPYVRHSSGEVSSEMFQANAEHVLDTLFNFLQDAGTHPSPAAGDCFAIGEQFWFCHTYDWRIMPHAPKHISFERS